jgi:hypothetical protein
MALTTLPANAFADDAITSDKINLANNFAFTGTVSGTPSDMVMITSTNVTSAVSSVDFTISNQTAYNNFQIHCGDIRPVNNGTTLNLRFKLTNSSDFESGSDTYSNQRQRVYQGGGSTWVVNQGGYNTTMGSASMGVNSSGNGYSEAQTNSIIWLHNVFSTDRRKAFISQSYGATDNQNGMVQQQSATYTGSNSMDALVAIRVMFDTGNIAKGRYTLYGMKT